MDSHTEVLNKWGLYLDLNWTPKVDVHFGNQCQELGLFVRGLENTIFYQKSVQNWIFPVETVVYWTMLLYAVRALRFFFIKFSRKMEFAFYLKRLAFFWATLPHRKQQDQDFCPDWAKAKLKFSPIDSNIPVRNNKK